MTTDSPVWLNGSLLPKSAAMVDPSSQGFLCGMGVYDSLLLLHGVPVAFERHLCRLADGAGRLQLPPPDSTVIREAVEALAQALGLTNGRVRITLAAGPSDTVNPGLARGNMTLVTLVPLTPVKPAAALTLTPFRRNEHSPLAGIKYTACAENFLAQRASLAGGFDEALFLNTSGNVCEGAFSNVFIVAGNRILTPSLASGCLPGVTREIVLELCAQHGIPAGEMTLPAPATGEADEIFLTSSIRGIQPVSRLDVRPFPAPGELVCKLMAHYEQFLVSNHPPDTAAGMRTRVRGEWPVLPK